MSRRIPWTWGGNPNHVDAAPWSRRRWKREGKITRALVELPALLAGVSRLAVRSGDGRVRQIADQLALVTPEGLGLLWYVPPTRGGGKTRPRWYIPAAADQDVSAALALVHETYRLLTSWGRAFYRETRQLVAALARAVRREGFTAYGGASPHPTTGAVSLSRDNSCSSERPGAAWLKELIARRGQGGGEEVR